MATQNVLPFRPPCALDVQAIKACTKHDLRSDISAANLFLLRHKYDTQLVFHMEHLIRFYPGKGRLCGYTFPVGGCADNIPRCLESIIKDSETRNIELRFCLLTENEAQYIKEYFGENTKLFCDAGDADYLYKRRELATLAGTKFHKKRNRLAAFKRHYPQHGFAPLTSENKHIARQIAEQWYCTQIPSPALIHELEAIKQALLHFDTLELQGGLVYVNLVPVGMCIASLINEHVADVHYEKCLPDFRDAYVYINNELAQHLNSEFINREEDLNIPGLRAAKLTYNPSIILKKYSAIIC